MTLVTIETERRTGVPSRRKLPSTLPEGKPERRNNAIPDRRVTPFEQVFGYIEINLKGSLGLVNPEVALGTDPFSKAFNHTNNRSVKEAISAAVSYLVGLEAKINDAYEQYKTDTAAAALDDARNARIRAFESALPEAKPEPTTKKTTTPATPPTPSGGAAAPKSGALPDDFPGVVYLLEAGIATYAQARKVEDFTTIPGIGESTAEKIKAALK